MAEEINKPLDLELRRRAAYLTLSEVLSGDMLLQAMWMIEERDPSADRLTFLGIVGVTAEIFGIDAQIVTSLYTRLNNNLLLSEYELPPNPMPEMLKFRGISPPERQQISQNIALDSDSSLDAQASIFRNYDILGIAGKTLTNDVIQKIGKALASEAKEHNSKTVIIARDGRKSSIEMSESLAKGIMSRGLNVIDLGLVPMPVLYFVCHFFKGKTAAMITGGNHSSQYNGLKLVIAGEILEGKKIQRLKHSIEIADFSQDEAGTLEHNTDYINEYIALIVEDITLSKPLKIVLDSGNGTMGDLASKVMLKLGCEVIELYENIDENFPNHAPDPSKPENLANLSAKVQEQQADVGFAFDNIGTCLGVVDCNGKIIRPDRQIMLFSKTILKSHPISEIIYDVECTGHLTKLINQCKGRPLMWKTGPAYLKNKLVVTAAKMAGDKSGHFHFNDRWFAYDDALYAACRMLESLSSDTRSSSEIFAELPECTHTSEFSIELPEGENRNTIESLNKERNFPGGKITDIDGLRVDFPESWTLIRAAESSNNLEFHFEADSEEALTEIQKQFEPLFFKDCVSIESD